MQPVVLASASPRRRELLSSFGIPLIVNAAGIDESFLGRQELPEEVARRLALSKARFVADRNTLELPILGADTIVSLDGRILGKPKTRTEARQMLRALCGRSHQVITGVAVIEPISRRVLVEHQGSNVMMRRYSETEIEAFIATGEAMDKAGAYAIQDATFHPVASVAGCYSNVMGLPMCTAIWMLQELGGCVSPLPGWEPPGPCLKCEALGKEEREIS
jgi:MAF protein